MHRIIKEHTVSNRNFQIAIDGPAGAGKSTIAKIVAKELGFVYIDTGAMYRAMGLFFDQNGEWPKKSEDIRRLAGSADITLKYKDGVQEIYLNGKNVTSEIRTEKAGLSASAVSKFPEVREILVTMQRKLAETTSVIMDGRDIGTVVLKDADVKVFLTANVNVRSERRRRQLAEQGIIESLEKIEEDIRKRDIQDSTRKASPLKMADDAILVDTSDCTLEESVERIIALAKEKMA